MTLEGLHEFERVRDFLYSRMRGVKATAAAPTPENDIAAALHEVANELRAVREALEKS
jgi:putative membrane protein